MAANKFKKDNSDSKDKKPYFVWVNCDSCKRKLSTIGGSGCGCGYYFGEAHPTAAEGGGSKIVWEGNYIANGVGHG